MNPDDLTADTHGAQRRCRTPAPPPRPARPPAAARAAAPPAPGSRDHAAQAQRLLRRDPRGQGGRPRLRRQPRHGHDRPVGLRQVDARALHQPHARGDPGGARRPARSASTTSTSTTTGVDVVSVRRAIGMVFQKPNPFPTMSIFDNVAAGLRLSGTRGDTRERVEQSLRGAGLWEEVKDRLDQPGIGLSGGQQQRLCIARTIAVEPEVILMDEPCSALDPIATLKIEELIHELKQRYTIVIVTHNMQQAARVADTTAFMLAGEMIEHAATDKIFSNAGRQPHGGVRHREVRLAMATGEGRQTLPGGAAAARGVRAGRDRHGPRAARPRARGARAPGHRARHDRHPRRRPPRRALPRGPPGHPHAAGAPGARSRATCGWSRRCCTSSSTSSAWATSA